MKNEVKIFVNFDPFSLNFKINFNPPVEEKKHERFLYIQPRTTDIEYYEILTECEKKFFDAPKSTDGSY